MLLPTKRPFRPHRRPLRKAPSATPPAPPVPLVLIAAAYDPGLTVTLTFDRPIDVSGFQGAFVIVRDGPEAYLYDAAGGAVLVSPATAELTLVLVEGDASVGVTMNAMPENGIVAQGDGGAWGGVSELPLPFP